MELYVSGIILGTWYSQRMKQTPLPAWSLQSSQGKGKSSVAENNYNQ